MSVQEVQCDYAESLTLAKKTISDDTKTNSSKKFDDLDKKMDLASANLDKKLDKAFTELDKKNGVRFDLLNENVSTNLFTETDKKIGTLSTSLKRKVSLFEKQINLKLETFGDRLLNIEKIVIENNEMLKIFAKQVEDLDQPVLEDDIEPEAGEESD